MRIVEWQLLNQCNERLCIETSNRWTIFLYCGKNRNNVDYLYWVFSKQASTSTLPALKNITSVINYLTEKMVQTCIVTFHNRGRDPLTGPKERVYMPKYGNYTLFLWSWKTLPRWRKKNHFTRSVITGILVSLNQTLGYLCISPS